MSRHQSHAGLSVSGRTRTRAGETRRRLQPVRPLALVAKQSKHRVQKKRPQPSFAHRAKRIDAFQCCRRFAGLEQVPPAARDDQNLKAFPRRPPRL